MSLALTASITAMAPGRKTYFLGTGGTEPYAYSVLPGGAGGTIDPVSGLYEAPATMNANPALTSDTIQVVDDDTATATAQILIADPLFLLCEIIRRELGLAAERVFIWNQKWPQPMDAGLYIAVSILNCKPFSNNIRMVPTDEGMSSVQSTNFLATLSINAISRNTEALLRKEEILLALGSLYSQSQQELNNFLIGKLPPGSQFISLSGIDGAAIPYRFNISVNMQYMVRKTKVVSYFDDFADVGVVTES